MITLFGDHVIKLDSGPRNYKPPAVIRIWLLKVLRSEHMVIC